MRITAVWGYAGAGNRIRQKMQTEIVRKTKQPNTVKKQWEMKRAQLGSKKTKGTL